ncbi:MAG: Gfo/Idh/MocA family oxidoreductase [Egibacteraceae bacterium]
MTNTRIALAGYGRFGRRQADVIDAHAGADLVAVADPSPGARERVAARYPKATLHEDPLAMLAETDADAVLIVSPEDTHAGIARAGLERGLHVLSEKPLATELAEARALVELARARDRVYQVGYLLRYEPRHVLLRGQVRDGSFGPLATIRAKRNCSRAWFEAYGSRVHPVYETLVHDIDLTVWLTGERCRRVSAWERRNLGERVPDTFVAVLEFASGTLAIVESTWLVPSGAAANIVGWGEGGGEGDGVIDAALEIVGVERSGTLDSYEPSLTITGPHGTAMPDTSFWPELNGRTAGALREELWDFVVRVAGGEGAGVASIDDALHTQEIADAAVAAASAGHTVEVAGVGTG